MPTCFLGVFPCDKLPEIKNFPSALVANTHPSTKPGQHWVGIYFADPYHVEYFCSYGFPPKVPAFKRLLKQFDDWSINSKKLQGDFSSVCGQYCIYFLIKRNQGLRTPEIVQQFGQNYQENDELIKCYVNDSFDLETVQYDDVYLIHQICVALFK